ncbi:MAG: ATP-binding protein [Ignavibacteriaceae bacterium]
MKTKKVNGFLSNYRVSVKLALISSAFILPVIVLLYFLISEQNIRIDFAQKELYGNEYLRPLKKLLELAPAYKHLNHNRKSSDTDIQDVQNKVDEVFAGLKITEKRLTGILNTKDKYNQLVLTWDKLKRNPHDVELNNEFILEIKMYISYVGNVSNLILDPDLDSYYIMDATVLKLPETMDLLYFILTFGKNVILSDNITVDDKTTLIIQTGLLKTNTEALFNGVNVAFENNPSGVLRNALSKSLGETINSNNDFISYIEKNILENGSITAGAEEYEKTAVETLQANFNFWDEAIVEFDNLLNKRIDGFNRSKYLTLGSVAFILILTLIFVSLITKNITASISLLSDAAHKFSEGETNIKVELNSKDELGKLADTFNEMIIKIKESILKLNQSNEKLAEYSSTLEEKVELRTKMLSEKNKELDLTIKELQNTQTQLVQSEKMASLGQLTAGIAHEIKNPLNFVNNFAQLSADLTKEVKDDICQLKNKVDPVVVDSIFEMLSDLEQNVVRINEHGKRADSIVKGMLLHSRGKSGELQKTDINNLLKEYVNLGYHGFRAQDSSFNVKIETDYDPSLGMINLIPQDISRVFLNIINNACYSVNDKKNLLGNKFDPVIKVSTKSDNGKARIVIRDNGKGIPQNILVKLFNPFFTTKPTGKGTGLGLSISYDIVVMVHKGEIKVESEEGEYAEFTITLPKNL